jgi:hypothetical protein
MLEQDHKMKEEVNKLMEVLTDISSMCIGEIAMGYKLDAQAIGEMIYIATVKSNAELNDYMKEVELK